MSPAEIAAGFGSGLIVHPFLGVLVTGSGDYHYDDSYSGDSGGLTPAPTTTSVDDASGFAAGVDVLGTVSPTVRVGGGLFWVPSMKATILGQDQKAGNQVLLDAIVEPIVPVSPKVAFAFRGQVGLGLLFTGGDLQKGIDAEKTACNQDLQDGDPKCDVSGSPTLGWNLGGGGGVIGNTGRVRLRADVQMQYISQRLYKREHTHQAVAGVQGEYTHSETFSISGTRFWLLGGIEF